MTQTYLDESLKAFLQSLATGDATRGAERVATFTAASAATLMAAAARGALPEASGPSRGLVEGVETVRGQLLDVLALDVWLATGPPAQEECDALMQLADHAASLLHLGARVLEQAPTRTPSVSASLGTAAPLPRAAVDSAVQVLLATVGNIEDPLAQTALKTRALALVQKARAAEATSPGP
jgi:hypothetical protein